MSVKVAIRVRPFNQREKFLSCTCCVQMKNNTTVVSDERDRKKKKNFFTFDYSFWSHDGFQVAQNGMLVPINDQYISQQHVYDELGRDVVANALMGYNCCLFAYGQTGSGKSYSMIGFGVNKGIIPMACAEIFRTIANKHQKGHLQYEVSLSMLEIYNEKVQDLFVNPSKRPNNGLKIRENKTLGVYVEGITKYKVSSYEQIEMKMEMGSKNRSLASTLMNEYSSRAHTIVMIQFIQKQFITSGKMSKKTSQINLVDLAGSERVAKTGINDNKDRLKEASLINKSLHTLGRCIEALAQLSQGKTNNIQVPYRDSVLTRILENALGGNSKTTMICAISPANDNYDETLSTLRYADKTKKIKNKPVINQSAVDRLIRQLRQQNDRLKGLLQTSPESSKESKSNVKASIKQVQRQIRQNLQSFAISGQVIQQQDSLMMTTFVDLQNQDINNLSMQYNASCQVYITNLNQDEFLSYKVKYSCQNNLIITNKYKNTSSILVDEEKLVLCGLGIELNHAKIFRQNNQFYIETLNEKSSEYTLVNGQQINHTSRLYHNDRIIFGINSVFIFKNLLDKQQRLIEKYTDQSQIDYEFAVNERQFAMENISLLSSRGSPIRNSRMEKSRIDMRQSIELRIQNQMKQKLSEIEKQFQFLVLENNEKSKKKQQDHFKMLLDIEQQKEQEKQKLQDQLKDKEEKLKEREYQTIQLKNNQQQLEKLKKKLEIYQQKRKNTENKVQSQKQNKVNQQEEEEEELLLDTQVNNVVKTDETNNTTSGKVKLQFKQLYSIQIDGKNEVEKLKFTHQEVNKEIEQKLQMKNEQLRKKSEEQLSISISDLIKEKKDNEQNNSLENERDDTLLIEEQNFQNEENNNKITKQNNKNNKNNKNKERISQIILYQNQFDENKLNNNDKQKQKKNIKRRQTVDFNLSVSDIDINDFDQQNSYFNLVSLETQKERQLSEKIKLLEDKINNLQCAVQHETSVVQNTEITKQQSSNICKNSQKNEQQRKIEKQLIIQCNNENIIKERNTSIHKKKRQIEDLTKIWYRKEKVQLQKDLLVLIPMIQRFNLMAREMKKLIQGKISIDYKHFTNYQIIQILRNYTNSKNKQPAIIIEIIIENYLEGRIYKWSIQTFRNRYQIAEQMFQIYLENENKNNLNNTQYSFDNDKNNDPFWDPIYYIPQGISYLSLQCLLYHMEYNDYISIVYHTQIIAKLSIQLKPVLKFNNENIKNQLNIENNQFSYEINNPRNYLQKELCFDLYIESIQFQGINSKNNSIKKFYISYQLLEKDYKNFKYKTLEIQYNGQKQQNINYMRRHYFKNITQRTLVYLIDCPIKFIFYTIKDFNQDLFNHSFNTTISEQNLGSFENLKGEKDNQSIYAIETIKSKQNELSSSMMDFTRKKKNSIFYENTEMIKNIDKNYKQQQNKRKRNNNKQKQKQKQCSIY